MFQVATSSLNAHSITRGQRIQVNGQTLIVNSVNRAGQLVGINFTSGSWSTFGLNEKVTVVL